MHLTAQAPCYRFGMEKWTHLEKKGQKINLWKLKNDKIKKAVKDISKRNYCHIQKL